MSDRFEQLDPKRRALLAKLLEQQQKPTTPRSDRAADGAMKLDHPRKIVKRSQYDDINARLNDSDVADFAYFLNYGYVEEGSPVDSRVQLGKHVIDRGSRRLVLEVLGDWPLDGQRVLDVGCGRGGAAVILHEYFNVASYLGIDLSEQAVAFCQRSHPYRGFRFEQGDAEALQVADASRDAVVNIESSHCYPDTAKFYAEVSRALRPGGAFLYTDFFSPDDAASLPARLMHLGLAVDRQVDITRNVLLSCDETASKRLSLFDGGEVLKNYMANVLAQPGSDTYARLQAGEWRYVIVRAVRPS